MLLLATTGGLDTDLIGEPRMSAGSVRALCGAPESRTRSDRRSYETSETTKPSFLNLL